MKPFGRARELADLGDLDKGSELAEFHGDDALALISEGFRPALVHCIITCGIPLANPIPTIATCDWTPGTAPAIVGSRVQKDHFLETFTIATTMKTLSLASLNLAATVEQLAVWLNPCLLASETHHSPDLLQCTQRALNDEAPDPRYWTAYDHFMVEREARARRRAYVYGLIARAWRALAERLRRRRKAGLAHGARGG